MLRSRRPSRALTLAALTAAITLTSVGPASGQATPIRFSNPPVPIAGQFGPGDDVCFASGGTITGTRTTSGTHFQTALGFHLDIHNVIDYTLRYDDPTLPV